MIGTSDRDRMACRHFGPTFTVYDNLDDVTSSVNRKSTINKQLNDELPKKQTNYVGKPCITAAA